MTSRSRVINVSFFGPRRTPGPTAKEIISSSDVPSPLDVTNYDTMVTETYTCVFPSEDDGVPRRIFVLSDAFVTGRREAALLRFDRFDMIFKKS